MSSISVIVPAYNVAPYLDDAVRSVCAQTCTDWEMLLVDDGSADASPQMCDAWTQKDSRIRVIHKENGGVSSARNAGLDQARGEFVFFLDADDYLHPRTFEILLGLADEHQADIALGFTRGTDRRDYTEEPDPQALCIQTASGKEALLHWMHSDASMQFFGYSAGGVVAKLFRRSIFQTVRFDTDAKTGEDTEILPYLLDGARTVVSTNQRLYFVYHRPGSLTRGEFSAAQAENLCRLLCRMYQKRIAYFRAKRDEGYADLLQITYNAAFIDLIEKREKYKKLRACRRILRKGLRVLLRGMYKERAASPVRMARNTVLFLCPFIYSAIYARARS